MKKSALASLKLNYSKYAPLWEQWCDYRFNDLFHDEVQLVNFYIKNDFSPHDDDRLYLSRAQNIQKVSEKLESCYPAFQEWVISEFQLGLIRLGSKHDWHEFIYSKIEVLPIPQILKSQLSNLGQENIRQIAETFESEDFRSSDVFSSILAIATSLLVGESSST